LQQRATPAPSSPVPGPASNSGVCCNSAQAMVEAEVVLAMPISPPMNNCTASCLARNTLSAPVCRASLNWLSVMAGATAKFAVAGAMISRRTFGHSPGSLTVPRLTTSSLACNCCAKTQIAAPPRAKFFTISPVTACGKADTPSAAMP